DAEAEEDGKDKSKLGDDDQEDDEYDEDVHPAQRLSIKNAFLSGDDGKVHMVSIETLGYKGAEVKCPLVAMKAGTDIQRAVDMEFSTKVKLTLTHGKDPSHSSFKDMNQTSILEEDDEDSGEEEEMEAEEAEAATNGNNKNGIDKKRKATDAGEDAAALKKEKLASPAKKAAA
ncbi:Mitotic apparatus protein p62, partial [Caligus rogercresseyi]